MTKFKKILIGSAFISTTALLFMSASCNKTISLMIQDPTYGADPQKAKMEIQKIFNNNLKNKNIKVNVIIGDPNVDSIIKGTEYDFGFVSAGQISSYLNDSNNKLPFIPKIQTLTNAFYKDTQNAKYSDGSINDPLRKITAQENQRFSEMPVDQWNKENWNGSIWVNQYDQIENSKTQFHKVGYQRGVMWIYGDDELRNKIIQAWNNKDWKTFKSFGIIIGENTSSSKYLLPQNLLRKHFDKPNNDFISFAQIADDPKITTASSPIKDVEKRKDYKILFDNQGSFAYTSSKKLIERYSADKNEKLQYFMLTNSTPYNIGIFNSNLPKTTIDAITNVFLNLKNKDNEWGDNLGFNGYERITEFDKNQKQSILDSK